MLQPNKQAADFTESGLAELFPPAVCPAGQSLSGPAAPSGAPSGAPRPIQAG